MNVKKTFLILIFASLMIATFSTSAFSIASWTAQNVNIPYVSVNATAGYWAGVSIHNESSSMMTVNLFLTDSTGATVATSNCNNIDAGGSITDLLDNFFNTTIPTGRYTLNIESNGASSNRFSATLFMGNTGESNPGFAFQSFRSENFESSYFFFCVMPI